MACTFLINVLSQRPLEDTTQDRELLEKCLELFQVMEKRCHMASVLLYVRATQAGPTSVHSSFSAIIGGIVREPNFNPLGPYAKRGEDGRGWVVNAENTQSSTPTDVTNSEPSRSLGAGAAETEMGPDYGLDITFV